MGIFLFILSTLHPGFSQQEKTLPFPIHEYQLKNGLQVILSEDQSLPVVSVVVAYNVGSSDDPPGKSGLAYLLENLMFQGSQNIGRMQHINFIQRTGGSLNAITLEDRTIFSQSVPSNQLALVLWLESDRMKSLAIHPANVKQAKEANLEEVVQKKSSQPYLKGSHYLDELLFSDFAYHHPVIGSEEDLREITVEDVESFYSMYYRPNNAVLCVVGSINRKKTEELISRYFESISPGKKPLPHSTAESTKIKSKTETLENSQASYPAFHLGYRIAAPYTDDYYPLVIIEYLLIRGKSSRLQKRLIKKERIAYQLSGGIDRRKDRAAFKIFVVHSNERLREANQNALFSEINKLKTNLVSSEELLKAKNMFKTDYLNQYSTSTDKAIFLAEALLAGNSLGFLFSQLDRYLAVTSSNVIGIMNRYFIQDYFLLNIKIK